MFLGHPHHRSHHHRAEERSPRALHVQRIAAARSLVRLALIENLQQFLVDTPFVRGTLKTWVFPEDLRQWQQALDSLDAGQDIAWCEGKRIPAS